MCERRLSKRTKSRYPAEVLERYPIDGVFFNMFGYFTRDYSHTIMGFVIVMLPAAIR
jgi:hypothetical protein